MNARPSFRLNKIIDNAQITREHAYVRQYKSITRRFHGFMLGNRSEFGVNIRGLTSKVRELIAVNVLHC
jgi:hypothetical protein